MIWSETSHTHPSWCPITGGGSVIAPTTKITAMWRMMNPGTQLQSTFTRRWCVVHTSKILQMCLAACVTSELLLAVHGCILLESMQHLTPNSGGRDGLIFPQEHKRCIPDIIFPHESQKMKQESLRGSNVLERSGDFYLQSTLFS